MYLSDTTLDDLMLRVFQRLLDTKRHIHPTRGEATELTGVLLQLTNPRARLSRTETKGKLFSCLGELFWYLAKTNDVKFITHYVSRYKDESDDGRVVYGGYGPRLFSMDGCHDQIHNVTTLLRKHPDSRRAVIQLFDAADIDSTERRHKEIPCTCTLQFMIRQRRLHMFTNMRSNDAYVGLPHDIFVFTMLQEIVARSLGIEVGKYKHFAASLHLYKKDAVGARRYLEEGWQSTVHCMPPMPAGDPWASIALAVKAERAIRLKGRQDIPKLNLDNYWKDLLRLLEIFAHSKFHDGKSIARLKRTMSVRIYDIYIEQKRQTALKRAKRSDPEQLGLL
jgi:thymidylate synthase